MMPLGVIASPMDFVIIGLLILIAILVGIGVIGIIALMLKKIS